MICDLCGESGAQVRHVSRSYGKRRDAVRDRERAHRELSALRRKLPDR